MKKILLILCAAIFTIALALNVSLNKKMDAMADTPTTSTSETLDGQDGPTAVVICNIEPSGEGRCWKKGSELGLCIRTGIQTDSCVGIKEN